jgi:uncharacterized membrane protein YfcA
MEKFTLYDFLGLILPGCIFLFFTNMIVKLYGLQAFIEKQQGLNLKTGLILIFAVIIGALLYVLSFYLVKRKWYNRLFGMYRHVADLYVDLNALHKIVGKTLNKKAMEWFKKNIFLDKQKFRSLMDNEKDRITELQGQFYDRMFYELEYHGKKEHANTFHSFYFFFRQTALASILLILLTGVFYLSCFIPFLNLSSPDACKLAFTTASLFLMLFISVQLAQWYRKRMVLKMYWTYYTHIKQT